MKTQQLGYAGITGDLAVPSSTSKHHIPKSMYVYSMVALNIFSCFNFLEYIWTHDIMQKAYNDASLSLLRVSSKFYNEKLCWTLTWISNCIVHFSPLNNYQQDVFLRSDNTGSAWLQSPTITIIMDTTLFWFTLFVNYFKI